MKPFRFSQEERGRLTKPINRWQVSWGFIKQFLVRFEKIPASAEYGIDSHSKLVGSQPGPMPFDSDGSRCSLLRFRSMTAHLPKLLIFPCLAALLQYTVGCDRDDSGIKVYKVSKAPASSPPQMPPMAARSESAQPASQQATPLQIIGNAPSEWQGQPASQMRQASFHVNGEDEAQADISLVVLGGTAGGSLDNVNRWRNQLGEPPITETELESSSQRVSTAIGEGLLVDIEGTASGKSKNDGRIVAIILRRGGESWFFKMRGNAELVGSQKDAFQRWVESVRIGRKDEPANSTAAITPPAESPPIGWTLPTSWSPAAPKPMRFASFSAAGPDGDPADISVATFPGDTGGDLLNVNRWLNQLGMPPVVEAELETLIKPVDGAELPMKLVDLQNGGSRMLVAWTMHNGQSWFFKMTGPFETLEAEKSNFAAFVKSLHFHHH